jgi:hypothetical protein
MKRFDWRRAMAIAAVVIGALAIARLADAFGKRELTRVARDVGGELARARSEHDRLAARADGLEQDRQLLEQRIDFMSKREHYLVVDRRRRRLQLFLGDQELLDVGYRLKGPTDGVDGFRALPGAKLEVLGKRVDTDWYKPDWLYKLEGVEPPENPDERLVRNAFGPGELYLGGGIAIHGESRGGVPDEAIDHSYIELDDKSLKAVVLALEPGSKVFIE